MALTKAELARNLHACTGFSKEKSIEIVETTLELMKKNWRRERTSLYPGSASGRSGRKIRAEVEIPRQEKG